MDAVCATCGQDAHVEELFEGECVDCRGKAAAYATCAGCGSYVPTATMQDGMCPSCYENYLYARWFYEQIERDRYDIRSAS